MRKSRGVNEGYVMRRNRTLIDFPRQGVSNLVEAGSMAFAGDRISRAGTLLRLAGLALIGISAAAILWLFKRVHLDTRHVATAFEYLLALIGFAGASAGSVLLVLGTHIFDEIEVSERWRPRS